MGITNWLARKGNVGGTARWTGKLYLSISQENPSAGPTVVIKDIVKIRYSADSQQSIKDALLSHIDSGESRGLAHLVTNILTIESGYRENTQEDRVKFMKIIQEELRQLGIPKNII